MSYVEDARELELELRARLDGRHVVLEIGVDAELHERVTRVLEPVVRYMSASSVARTFPALVVTYLTGHAIYHYRGGIWGTIDIDGVNHEWGQLFFKATQQLKLESFDELVARESAQRHVSRIVAHGGIPAYCVGDLFRLIFHDVKYVGSAVEMIARWRARKSTFVGIDVPVPRFFLYGGDLAVDFLDRCLDVVRHDAMTGTLPAPEDVGLPAYVLVRYGTLPRDEGRRRLAARTRGRKFAKPFVEIDAWSGNGPVLVLPAIDGDGEWVARFDGLQRVPTTSRDTIRVPLPPSVHWEIDLEVDDTQFEWTIAAGGEAKLLCFDSLSGRLLNSDGELRAAEAIVMTPAAVTLEASRVGEQGPVTVLEELPFLLGAWNAWRARRLDLIGVDALITTSQSRAWRTVVRPPAGRPEVVTESVPSVRSRAGLPVFAACPMVRLPIGTDPSLWSVRTTSDGRLGSPTAASNLIDSTTGLLDVARVVPADATMVDLLVRGPMGDALRIDFCIVPGLRVRRPESVLFPADEATVVIAADVGRFAGSAALSEQARVPHDRGDMIFEWQGAQGAVDLVVGIPRLVWGVAYDNQIRLSTDQVKLVVSDVLDGTATAVSIAAGLPLEHAALELWSGSTALAVDGHPTSPSGRWTFSLDRFADALRVNDETTFELKLRVGSRSTVVAALRATLEIANLKVHSRLDGDFTRVDLEFDEGRAVKHRVVRLWPRYRPWKGFIQEPIPDTNVGHASIDRYGELPPGPYTVELGIDDGWGTPPSRPPRGPNTAEIDIGTADEVADYIESLDVEHPHEVLEIAVTIGRVARLLDAAEIKEITRDALVAVRSLLDQPRLLPQQLAAVAALIADSPENIARALIDVSSAPTWESVDLTVVQVVLAGPVFRSTIPNNLDDRAMRELWAGAPITAAALDMRGCDVCAAARLLSECGWDPNEGVGQIVPGEAPQWQFLDIDRAQLDEIIMTIQLLVDVPSPWFEIDAHVRTTFEWLRADKAGSISAFELWHAGRDLVAAELAQATNAVRTHLERRLSPVEHLPAASFGAVSLACALHVLRGSWLARPAQLLLVELARVCPRLVTRDLMLAMALIACEENP